MAVETSAAHTQSSRCRRPRRAPSTRAARCSTCLPARSCSPPRRRRRCRRATVPRSLSPRTTRNPSRRQFQSHPHTSASSWAARTRPLCASCARATSAVQLTHHHRHLDPLHRRNYSPLLPDCRHTMAAAKRRIHHRQRESARRHTFANWPTTWPPWTPWISSYSAWTVGRNAISWPNTPNASLASSLARGRNSWRTRLLSSTSGQLLPLLLLLRVEVALMKRANSSRALSNSG